MGNVESSGEDCFATLAVVHTIATYFFCIQKPTQTITDCELNSIKFAAV